MMEDTKVVEAELWDVIDPEVRREWDQAEAWGIHEAASDVKLQSVLALLSGPAKGCCVTVKERILDGQVALIEDLHGVAADNSPYVFDLATRLYKEREARGKA